MQSHKIGCLFRPPKTILATGSMLLLRVAKGGHRSAVSHTERLFISPAPDPQVRSIPARGWQSSHPLSWVWAWVWGVGVGGVLDLRRCVAVVDVSTPRSCSPHCRRHCRRRHRRHRSSETLLVSDTSKQCPWCPALSKSHTREHLGGA